MMDIAILGASSQIAGDLIVSFSTVTDIKLFLFARHPDAVKKWLKSCGLQERYPVSDFSDFGTSDYDVILNFIGVGSPVQAISMGSSILDITLRFDDMALGYLKSNPRCRYFFLSSGAVYGSSFGEPVNANTPATIAINNLSPQDWYGVAKLYAECRHRAHPDLNIIDVRVFNYFSRTQDISARFLITDILRAIRDGTVLKTSPGTIVRDFLHPSDFYRLVNALLSFPAANAAVDCYTRAPIDKATLLETMKSEFGLRYEVTDENAGVNATGSKPHYYSLNRHAADFGYEPALTSMEGILIESRAILSM